jgi:hypothetical protein
MEQSTTPTSTPTSIAPSSSPSTSAASNSWNSTSNTDDIEAKVEDLLSRMTLEDKVGQMIQLSRSADVEQTAKRIKGRRLGSLLNVIGAETADALQRYRKVFGGQRQTSPSNYEIIIHIRGKNYFMDSFYNIIFSIKGPFICETLLGLHI